MKTKYNQSSQRDAKTAAPLWFCHPCWLRYVAYTNRKTRLSNSVGVVYF